jgi:hypothetical protein
MPNLTESPPGSEFVARVTFPPAALLNPILSESHNTAEDVEAARSAGGRDSVRAPDIKTVETRR